MEKFIVALISCSFTMTAVALIYSLLSRWLKKIQSSKWRYYTWILVFIGFIVIFKPSFGDSALRINMIDSYVCDFTVGEHTFSPALLDQDIEYKTIFVLWLIGFLLNLSYNLIKQHLFYKSVKRLSKPAPKAVSHSAKKIASTLETAANFKVVTMSEISSPIITGFFKSLFILPDRQFSESELRLILKHEIIHIKHRDLFIKAFMLFCGAVHWFNPFIRHFIRSAEQEGELYCDEAVMEGEEEKQKKLYCQSILNSTSTKTKEKLFPYPAVSSGFTFNKHGLKHRMAMILSYDKKYKLGIIGILILALTLFTGTAVAFSDIRDLDGETFDTTTFAYTEETITFITYTEEETDNAANTEISF